MTPAHPIRAVVMDMDGLMLDTEGMSYVGWVRTFAERGLVFGRDRFLELVGLNVADARQKMLGWYGPEFPFEAVYARKMVHVDEIIAREGISQKPGLLEFLTAVDSLGLAKAVATSTARERALYKLKKVGLGERFDAFACGDEISQRETGAGYLSARRAAAAIASGGMPGAGRFRRRRNGGAIGRHARCGDPGCETSLARGFRCGLADRSKLDRCGEGAAQMGAVK